MGKGVRLKCLMVTLSRWKGICSQHGVGWLIGMHDGWVGVGTGRVQGWGHRAQCIFHELPNAGVGWYMVQYSHNSTFGRLKGAHCIKRGWRTNTGKRRGGRLCK